MGEGGRLQPKNGFELSLQAFKIEGLCSPPRSAPEYGGAYADFRLYKIEYFHISSTITNCSGQLIPDTVLSFSSALAGASPLLN